MLVQHWSVNISVNIARKIECYMSKSKLILCEWNSFYFSEIAFIDFTLREIKQCIVFFLGQPVDVVMEAKVLCISEQIVNGNTSIIFAHPEALLSKEGRKLMGIRIYQDNVVGCVVDEAHCVELWWEVIQLLCIIFELLVIYIFYIFCMIFIIYRVFNNSQENIYIGL